MLRKRIVFFFLLFTGLFFLIFPLYSETKKESSPKSQIAGSQTEKSYTPAPEVKISSPIPTVAPLKTSSPIPVVNTPLPISSPVVSTPSPTSISNQTPATQKNQINVSINGQTSFTVAVNEGSNQCDVLTKALQEGKISSLNMQYNSTYNSYAVYQINGVGKENSVWWVYKVNGVSPSQGCSFVKAENGNNVEWQYIGS